MVLLMVMFVWYSLVAHTGWLLWYDTVLLNMWYGVYRMGVVGVVVWYGMVRCCCVQCLVLCDVCILWCWVESADWKE